MNRADGQDSKTAKNAGSDSVNRADGQGSKTAKNAGSGSVNRAGGKGSKTAKNAGTAPESHANDEVATHKEQVGSLQGIGGEVNHCPPGFTGLSPTLDCKGAHRCEADLGSIGTIPCPKDPSGHAMVFESSKQACVVPSRGFVCLRPAGVELSVYKESAAPTPAPVRTDPELRKDIPMFSSSAVQSPEGSSALKQQSFWSTSVSESEGSVFTLQIVAIVAITGVLLVVIGVALVSLGRAVQRRKDKKRELTMHHASTDSDDGSNESKNVTFVHSSVGRSRSGSRRGVSRSPSPKPSRSRSMQSTRSKASSKKPKTKSALRSQSYIRRVNVPEPSRYGPEEDITEMTVRDCAEDVGDLGDLALQCVSSALCLPNDVEVRPIGSRGSRYTRSYPYHHSRHDRDYYGRDEGIVYEDIEDIVYDDI